MAPTATAFTDAAAAAAWLRAALGPGAQLGADHRGLRAGDGFIAAPGATHDARAFVADALAAGVRACLVEAADLAAWVDAPWAGDARVAALPGLAARAGEVAAAFYGHPARVMAVVAATGTNGKTSSTRWLAQALTALGRPAGVIGTLGAGLADADGGFTLETTGLTTPDAVSVHTLLHRLRGQGAQAVAIEASSIALAGTRLAGLPITVALLTNFTRDHLDFHGDMGAYWAAKRRLFAWPGLRAAVVNVDDGQGRVLADELRAEAAKSGAAGGTADGMADGTADGTAEPSAPALWTCGFVGPARLRGQGLRVEPAGLAFEVSEDGGPPLTVTTRLAGHFNAANLLGVIAALRALDVPLPAACAAAAQAAPVPGRMQRVECAGGQPADLEVIVDYAHTPDALRQALQALRPAAAARGGRLWCVVGCGGNRDTSKRPLMGAIAATEADVVVLTSDNPRDEPADAILAQMLAGADGVTARGEVDVIEDRALAIAEAIVRAAPGDVLLLAGKGHETTQEVRGYRRPFSDVEHAQQALQRRAAASAQAATAAKAGGPAAARAPGAPDTPAPTPWTDAPHAEQAASAPRQPGARTTRRPDEVLP
jgi:UDP-N-acetylmuramyl-tripeptide synthetase